MGRSLQFPIAFDIEETVQKVFVAKNKQENSAICRAFLEAVEEKGYKAILYSYTAFILQYLDIESLSDFDLWIADYRDESGSKCPYGGEKRIWQFKGDKGRCDGVSGACDLNICFRDYPKKKAEETIDYKEKYYDLKSMLEDILKNA